MFMKELFKIFVLSGVLCNTVSCTHDKLQRDTNSNQTKRKNRTGTSSVNGKKDPPGSYIDLLNSFKTIQVFKNDLFSNSADGNAEFEKYNKCIVDIIFLLNEGDNTRAIKYMEQIKQIKADNIVPCENFLQLLNKLKTGFEDDTKKLQILEYIHKIHKIYESSKDKYRRIFEKYLSLICKIYLENERLQKIDSMLKDYEDTLKQPPYSEIIKKQINDKYNFLRGKINDQRTLDNLGKIHDLLKQDNYRLGIVYLKHFNAINTDSTKVKDEVKSLLDQITPVINITNDVIQKLLKKLEAKGVDTEHNDELIKNTFIIKQTDEASGMYSLIFISDNEDENATKSIDSLSSNDLGLNNENNYLLLEIYEKLLTTKIPFNDLFSKMKNNISHSLQNFRELCQLRDTFKSFLAKLISTTTSTTQKFIQYLNDKITNGINNKLQNTDITNLINQLSEQFVNKNLITLSSISKDGITHTGIDHDEKTKKYSLVVEFFKGLKVMLKHNDINHFIEYLNKVSKDTLGEIIKGDKYDNTIVQFYKAEINGQKYDDVKVYEKLKELNKDDLPKLKDAKDADQFVDVLEAWKDFILALVGGDDVVKTIYAALLHKFAIKENGYKKNIKSNEECIILEQDDITHCVESLNSLNTVEKTDDDTKLNDDNIKQSIALWTLLTGVTKYNEYQKLVRNVIQHCFKTITFKVTGDKSRTYKYQQILQDSILNNNKYNRYPLGLIHDKQEREKINSLQAKDQISFDFVIALVNYLPSVPIVGNKSANEIWNNPNQTKTLDEFIEGSGGPKKNEVQKRERHVSTSYAMLNDLFSKHEITVDNLTTLINSNKINASPCGLADLIKFLGCYSAPNFQLPFKADLNEDFTNNYPTYIYKDKIQKMYNLMNSKLGFPIALYEGPKIHMDYLFKKSDGQIAIDSMGKRIITPDILNNFIMQVVDNNYMIRNLEILIDTCSILSQLSYNDYRFEYVKSLNDEIMDKIIEIFEQKSLNTKIIDPTLQCNVDNIMDAIKKEGQKCNSLMNTFQIGNVTEFELDDKDKLAYKYLVENDSVVYNSDNKQCTVNKDVDTYGKKIALPILKFTKENLDIKCIMATYLFTQDIPEVEYS